MGVEANVGGDHHTTRAVMGFIVQRHRVDAVVLDTGRPEVSHVVVMRGKGPFECYVTFSSGKFTSPLATLITLNRTRS